jgi:hypothetical protein
MGEEESGQWREWVTGKAPSTAQTHVGTLPAPCIQDTPSVPRIYRGRVCRVKACQKQDPLALSSLRFAPTWICVRCWQRWRADTPRAAEAGGEEKCRDVFAQ